VAVNLGNIRTREVREKTIYFVILSGAKNLSAV